MSKTINRYSIMKQKLNRYIFLLLVGFTQLVSVSAQRVYTLDECLQRALENNVRIKNAGNNLEIAKQGSQEAFTKYFPSLQFAALHPQAFYPQRISSQPRSTAHR